MILLEKWYNLTHLQKMPKNVGDLDGCHDHFLRIRYSVTRSGDLLDFGQLFKAFANN